MLEPMSGIDAELALPVAVDTLQLVPGSAAANSPLEVGEVIQSVNGTDCSYCSTDHLADLLLGAEGMFAKYRSSCLASFPA